MPKPDPQTHTDKRKLNSTDDANDPDLFADPPLPIAPLDDEQRLACLRLIRSENVGPVGFRQLINHFGGATQALAALPDMARHAGTKRSIQVCPKDKAEAELEAAYRAGATPIFTIEPGYPKRIALLDVPPPMLYVKGRIDLLNAPSVAIVGARQSSAAGQKLAQTFAADLGKAGLVVVSGLARGIDGAAHAAALQHGTIAVVAGGVDVIYPPEHDKLHASIAEQGCIISEMPCGLKPRGKDFPRRNRLISAASLGVLVVEAARRSGTLSTARMAGEQGRMVFAIPGHPLDPRAEGTNHLLKSGATLVTEPDDVVSCLAPLTAETAGHFNEPASNPIHDDDTSQLAQSIFTAQPAANPTSHSEVAHEPTEPVASTTASNDQPANHTALIKTALGTAPVEIDELIRTTGLPARNVRLVLLDLDIAGELERHGANLVSLKPTC